jgi:hypothetical protein
VNWKSIKLNLHRLIGITQNSHDKLDHSHNVMQAWVRLGRLGAIPEQLAGFKKQD